MPAPRNRKHLLVPTPPSSEEYTPHARKIVLPPVPGPRNRRQHASALKAALLQAERETKQERDALDITVQGAEPGLYVQFESPPGIELKLESLEDRGKGIELVAVQSLKRPQQPPVQLATVFVPDGQLKHFVTRFQQYATEQTKKGEPRHKDLVDRIAALRRATLHALWTDAVDVYPRDDEVIWWEVWLRRHDGRELERLLEFAGQVELIVGERRLAFDDRIVVLVKGSAAQLSTSLDVLNDVAEVRRAKDTAAFFADAPAEEQAQWVDDLKRRTTPPPQVAPAVCVLDTGVTRGHPLLQDVIAPNDAMAVDPTWGANDDGGGPDNMGHGTEMAGLAAYGDLVVALASRSPVALRHRVESVKILPPTGTNPPELYGAHLDRSDLEAVHDPAHAWNALTVGAFTEKAVINDPTRSGWSALARPGDLSPWSTTSILFQEMWPIKPDVVFEGGNVGRNGASLDFPVPDLCLLSTYYKPAEKPLVLSWATSAATAQVARMAILVRAEYPEFWPETVRALVVHSARWTSAMAAHLRGASGKRARAKLLRRYGFGVPGLERALRSANDALTLVVQSSIRPFADGKMKEMHLHELPWPKDVLEELGQTPVRLRVTLSYFVEPNPGRRGWRRRHRYASHGLRFDVKSPTESTPEFRKRLNQRALEEDEDRPTTGSDSDGWFLGEQTRNKGSIHSDVWTGTAADLAERGVLGVYPVSGWWKDQPKRDRSSFGARYALVVSIETEAQGVDIWTPVAQEIGVPVEIAAEV